MAVRAILFDLDGTLVEAKEWHYMALNRALSDIAQTTITRHEHLTALDGLPTRRKLQWLLERRRIRERHITPVQELKQDYTIQIIKTHCNPDYKKVEMCKRLSYIYKLACVSNAVTPSVELMLKRSGLFEYFDYIQGNEDVKPKPDPEPYVKTVRELGMRGICKMILPRETIAVEDHPRGVESAEAAGIKCLHLQYPEITLERIEREIACYTS
jgi:beta-phosphoglucomutase